MPIVLQAALSSGPHKLCTVSNRLSYADKSQHQFEQMNQEWNVLTKPSWLSCCLSKWCLCRLQLFCGMLARIEQFADVTRDSKLQIQKVNMPLALTLALLNHETAAVCVYTS